jgi:hypothetical protein
LARLGDAPRRPSPHAMPSHSIRFRRGVVESGSCSYIFFHSRFLGYSRLPPRSVTKSYD